MTISVGAFAVWFILSWGVTYLALTFYLDARQHNKRMAVMTEDRDWWRQQAYRLMPDEESKRTCEIVLRELKAGTTR